MVITTNAANPKARPRGMPTNIATAIPRIMSKINEISRAGIKAIVPETMSAMMSGNMKTAKVATMASIGTRSNSTTMSNIKRMKIAGREIPYTNNMISRSRAPPIMRRTIIPTKTSTGRKVIK